MTFLEPLFLWALPFAALPIVIHLLNLRRHRRVDWGAMQFLLRAHQQRRGQTRLRHLLVLIMRMLAIAALVLLVSRPLVGRWLGWMGGRPDTVIVVLDRSASMEQQHLQRGQTKRQLALDRLVDALRTEGSARSIVLVHHADLPAMLLESPEALHEVPATGATDGSMDIPGMMHVALDYLIANRTGRTDIWVCSDLQATDWQPQSERWSTVVRGFQSLRQPVRFHLLTYAQDVDDNVSVRLSRILRRQGAKDELVMDVELLHSGRSWKQAAPERRDGPEEADGFESTGRRVPLSIVVDGARSVTEIELRGAVTRLTGFSVPLDGQRKEGWGKLELPNDGNQRDNVFYFCYGQRVSRSTEVFAEQTGCAWPLRLAAAPPGFRDGTAAQANVSIAEDAWQNAAETWDPDATALVLWQGPLPAGKVAERLTRYVAAGGQIIFFPPLEPDAGQFMGFRWGDWQSPTADAPLSIDQWRDDSGLLADVESGAPLPVNRLEVTSYCQIEGQGQVAGRFASGDPLLVYAATDRGGVFFCTTLPQDPYSNLARQGIVFFAMVQRALAAGETRLLNRELGEIQRLDPQDLAVGQQLDGWPEGQISTQQALVAGVYQDEADRRWVHNRAAAEDRGERIDAEELAVAMGTLDYRMVEDSFASDRSLVSEIWRVCALALLAFLIVEALLCLPDVRPVRWQPA